MLYANAHGYLDDEFMEDMTRASEHFRYIAEVLVFRAAHLFSSDQLKIVNDQELLDLVEVFAHLGRLAESGQTLLAGEVSYRSRPELAEQRLSYRHGARNPSELLERTCSTSGRVARSRLRLGTSVRPSTSLTGEVLSPRFPALTSAVQSGAIDLEATAIIQKTLATAEDHGALMDDVIAAESSLVGAATGLDDEDVRNFRTQLTADAAQIRGEATNTAPRFWSEVTQPRMTVAQIEVMAQAWSMALDPDGALPDESVQQRRRGFSIGRVKDGTVRVTGELLPDVAAQLEKLFDAYLNPKVNAVALNAGGPCPVSGYPLAEKAPDHALDQDRKQIADGAFAPGLGQPSDHALDAGLGEPGVQEVEANSVAAVPDLRTPAQRRHDAFAGILAQAAGLESMPLLGGAPPTLVVATTIDQLTPPMDSASANVAQPGDPRDQHGDPLGQRGGNEGPGVAFIQGSSEEFSAVPATVARHIGCAGAIQRISLDAQGRITDISSSSRVFTAHQRRAIALRDGGCIIPGCTVRASWCEVHHVVEHSRGGSTSTDNGVLLCWYHHRNLESNGWTITMHHGIPHVGVAGRHTNRSHSGFEHEEPREPKLSDKRKRSLTIPT
ncbi:HNH endonuclease signature motif containing protein [Schaalia vaccimaxillae]|uniref:HNH endonuclease signature motif containing protein n=1 Tax=Schaalia vaccimaxillae TaxID=183916 RepID=UPI0003B3615C|nr:HNH endonuclease signature motif containing protein [Schaalia vaccimaxillae]